MYTGYAPYAAGPSPGTNGRAIAALVTALVSLALCPPLVIAAIPLGHVALHQIKRSGGVAQGRGIAIAALAVAYGAVALGTIVVAVLVALGAFASA
ncbi:MAG: DUF4190 domain-containing protein [Actinobacteria bacterium]|nr:DUF4190 domain-containing protein [Actinomycetota bacterium]